MGGFFSALGKSLAERWLSLLALPGALFVVVTVMAKTLGWIHPFRWAALADHLTHWAQAAVMRSVGGQVLVLLAFLAAAAGTGAVAQTLGSVVERLALAEGWQHWPPPTRDVANWLVQRRRARWDPLALAYASERAARREAIVARHLAGGRSQTIEETAAATKARDDAYRAMLPISIERPDRPTWTGDRINAVRVRLNRDLHLDIGVIWPYLWLELPGDVRQEITAARAALSRAATLMAWGTLYLLLTSLWWPALLIGASTILVGRARLRAAAHEYAVLLEAVTRSRADDLAARTWYTPDQYERVTSQLQGSPPTVPQPRS
ncbi:hypothetical protein [Streptomyces sp. NPDC001787]|uniref:hypothetical protein n=1 Tax=Streptomyces sp. NPDC001787 TaxID=3154523 RepID=UPI00332F87BC